MTNMFRVLSHTALFAICVGGCGGDSTGVNAHVLPATLVGTWVANSSCTPGCGYILTSTTDPHSSLDFVATNLLTVTLGLRADGGATLVLSNVSENGTAAVNGGALYLSSGGTTDTVDYVVTGTTLDLQFRAPLQADITGDGVPELVHAHAILKKQ